MPQYVGFSTIAANQPRTTNAPSGNDGGQGGVVKPITTGKKFRLVDEALVIQDLINALNIRQGEKVGQPGYGTTMWAFTFEPNDPTTRDKLVQEVSRIISLDPRVTVNSVQAYPQENGILVEVEMAVAPFNQAQVLSLFVDISTQRASIQ